MEPEDSCADPRRADDATRALVERLFQDAVGALELYTVYLGERLGRYRALAEAGSATSAELAERTGTAERYVRECGPARQADGATARQGRFRSRPPTTSSEASTSPSLLLWGDRMVPLRIAELAGARFGWPLHVVEDAGHVPHIEQPEGFLRALAAALLES